MPGEEERAFPGTASELAREWLLAFLEEQLRQRLAPLPPIIPVCGRSQGRRF